MIVKPTVKDLLDHAENRYALVIATSRRARQIAKGDNALTDVNEKSPVTIAANEISEGKVSICGFESEYDKQQKLLEENLEETENIEDIENIEEENEN